MINKEKAIELLKEAKDDVVISNCIALLERSQIGVQKYGTTLSDANLSQNDLIQHALEESLDLSNYLRTILMDSLKPTLKPTFKVGDKVVKNKGYIFEGEVIGVCKNSKGEIRVVVEHSQSKTLTRGGMLHIFNPRQLDIVL